MSDPVTFNERLLEPANNMHLITIRTIRLTAILIIAAVTLNPALAEEVVPPVKTDWPAFRGGVYQSGELFIGGQPLTQDAMQKLKHAGIKTIINMRTPAEMSDKASTPIPEVAVSEALGIRYVSIPSGGPDYPFSPATVAAFSEAMDDVEGPVFLHCNSGRRASHLWVAWLIDYKQMSPARAIELGRAANFGSVPLDGYLR